MKIFLSVGTHAQQFDRLLKEMDSVLAGKKIRAQVFAQTGNSSYKPKKYSGKKFLDEKEYNKKIEWAETVISHGGAGTIINALLKKKKLIIVPRLKKFGEHTNDHQLELAEAFEKEGKALAVFKIQELEEKLKKIKKFRPKTASNKEGLIKAISGFIEGLK